MYTPDTVVRRINIRPNIAITNVSSEQSIVDSAVPSSVVDIPTVLDKNITVSPNIIIIGVDTPIVVLDRPIQNIEARLPIDINVTNVVNTENLATHIDPPIDVNVTVVDLVADVVSVRNDADSNVTSYLADIDVDLVSESFLQSIFEIDIENTSSILPGPDLYLFKDEISRAIEDITKQLGYYLASVASISEDFIYNKFVVGEILTPIDTTSIIESIAKLIRINITTDIAAVTDNISRVVNYQRSITTDTISIIESIVVRYNKSITTDTITVNESFSPIISKFINFTTDTTSVSEQISKVIASIRTDSVNVSEQLSIRTGRPLSDTVNAVEAMTKRTGKSITTDSISSTETIIKSTRKNTSEAASISEILSKGIGLRATTDTTTIIELFARIFQYIYNVTEHTELPDDNSDYVDNTYYNERYLDNLLMFKFKLDTRFTNDILSINELVLIGLLLPPATLSDTGTSTDSGVIYNQNYLDLTYFEGVYIAADTRTF